MDYPHVIQTPGVCRGKPRIENTRIKVETIAEWVVHAGQTPAEVQKAHPQLDLGQIHAALAYYYDHQEDIEESLREGHRVADALRGSFPSKLPKRPGSAAPATE
jgi:uncharacterized protein (DUF433 family)